MKKGEIHFFLKIIFSEFLNERENSKFYYYYFKVHYRHRNNNLLLFVKVMQPQKNKFLDKKDDEL